MYTVSLLPLEYRNYQQVIKRNNRLFLVLLVAAVSLAVVLITSIAISSVYAEQLDMVKESNAEITEQINELKAIEQLQTQVAEMAASISQTAGLSPEWENLIAEIGNAAPPTIELDSISASYTSDKDAITIKGNASGLKDLTAMLESISQIQGLGEILFDYRSDPGTPDAISFQVTIQSLPAKPYELNLGGAK